MAKLEIADQLEKEWQKVKQPNQKVRGVKKCQKIRIFFSEIVMFASRVARRPLMFVVQSNKKSNFRMMSTERFTKTHEWVRLDENTKTAKIGITDYAQHKLGEAVYVQLPEIKGTFHKGEVVAAIESVKVIFFGKSWVFIVGVFLFSFLVFFSECI